jgi:hypothetical protein
MRIRMKKRYLFCVLIPIGLISLVLGVMGVVSFIKAGVIYEVACDRSEGTMLIPAKGTYSIWLSGPNNSVDGIAPSKPRLVNDETGKEVELSNPLGKSTVTVNGNTRIKIYTFETEAGSYTISANNEVGSTDGEMTLGSKLIGRDYADYSSFTLQVRNSTNFIFIALSVILILLGGLMMLAGVILPIVLTLSARNKI